MKKNSFSALRTARIVTTLVFTLTSTISLAGPGEQMDQQPASHETRSSQVDAFETYLTYRNHVVSKVFNIQSPWFVKGPKESEEGALLRVETHLQTQLQRESNSVNFPALMIKEVVDYERQVVCDEEKGIKVLDYKQTVVSRSDEGYTGVQRVDSKSNYNRRRSGADSSVNASSDYKSGRRGERGSSEYEADSSSYDLSKSGSSAYASAAGEVYNVSGRTVIHTREQEWEKTCVKKHYEFRGTLVAEKLLKYRQINADLKLYLVSNGVKLTHADFTQRIRKLSEIFRMTLSNPRLDDTDLRRFKVANAPALIAAMKGELTALVSTLVKVKSSGDFFFENGYPDFGQSILQTADDMMAKMLDIKGYLENFSHPNINLAFFSRGKIIPNLFYTQEELAVLFGHIGLSFDFTNRQLDPAQRIEEVRTRKNGSRGECAKKFESILDASRKAASGDQLFKSKYFDLWDIKDCTSEKKTEFRSDSDMISSLRSSQCIFSSKGGATAGGFKATLICQD